MACWTAGTAGGGRRGPGRRGAVAGALTAALALAVALPCLVPETPAHPGALWETVPPWSAPPVPVAAAAVLVRRSLPAGSAALPLLAVRVLGPGPPLVAPDPGAEPNLTVVTHNVDAATSDPAAVSGVLLSAAPDPVAPEEVIRERWEAYDAAPAGPLPYFARKGTAGLWSRHPVVDAAPVDTGTGWARALRAEADGPGGVSAVYVVHPASVRVDASGFDADRRNATVRALGESIAGEPLERVVLMGDLNASVDDRGLRPPTSRRGSRPARRGRGSASAGPRASPWCGSTTSPPAGRRPPDRGRCRRRAATTCRSPSA